MEQAAPEQEQSEDPIAMLAQGLQSLVEGISKSSAPDEAKKAFAASLSSFQQGMDMLGGGGGGGAQPMDSATSMGGGNPNARPA